MFTIKNNVGTQEIALILSLAALLSLSFFSVVVCKCPTANAQQQPLSGQATGIDTFYAKGLIATLISNPKDAMSYILAGYWDMNVTDGKIRDFSANFSMVHPNGTGYHTHELTNFKPNVIIPVLLDPKGITFLGMMDIKVDGNDKWFGIQTTVAINKLNTIVINPNPKYTENHFQGQPIYGTILSIKDKNRNELIKSHIR